MTILLSDPRVTAIPVHPVEDPLVRLDATFGPARAPVRAGLAERLARAADALSAGIGADARAHRGLLARVLGGAGLVNYPTEWWHWSYGDRYWALVTGAPAALYGPIETAAAA